jgi:hypothetical protein
MVYLKNELYVTVVSSSASSRRNDNGAELSAWKCRKVGRRSEKAAFHFTLDAGKHYVLFDNRISVRLQRLLICLSKDLPRHQPREITLKSVKTIELAVCFPCRHFARYKFAMSEFREIYKVDSTVKYTSSH